VSDPERRARLAVRHALAPAWRLGSPEAATRAMTVLHATEPATVYLSCWARVDGFAAEDLDRALYADRTLVKQLAMRRTLFVFPAALLPAVWPSSSARVAGTERSRIAKAVVQAGLATDGLDWLDRARAEVLAVLADEPDGRIAAEIRQAVPMINVRMPGELWIAPQVLIHLGLTGDLVRGTNAGGWHTSRPRWTLMRLWLESVPASLDPAAGYRELVRHWLHTFGPGTEDDLVWWFGSTKATIRSALADLGAVTVTLDGGATGWLLPDDTADTPDPGSWVALLPVLDPTVMGWKERGFYLGPHREQLFDRNGNAGTTAWVDGRIVGSWAQDAAGVVHVRLLEKVPARSRKALDAEAERLTAWLGGFRVGSVYSSPAMKAHGTAGLGT
jgi:hypothetical protein